MLNSWDFTEQDTKTYTHGFHTYPAMMIPQIAERLINTYKGKKAQLLFDPYCGTGTSLVEANIKGVNAIGTDLNPLARLIATAKTTIIDQQTVDLYLKDFNDFLFHYRFGIIKRDSVVIPQFSNIDFWFSRVVKNDLAVVKQYIDSLEKEEIRNFFKVAFSQTIRDCSWTRKNEFKLYKMDGEKLKTFKPDVFLSFEKALRNNRQGLLNLIEAKNNSSTSQVHAFNTVTTVPIDIISDKSVDIVVTSPPYGDSQTTVAYGQFSRLTNEWLGNENAQKVDSNLMGGKKYEAIEKFECSRTLNSQINNIRSIDELRAKEVYAFYKDYYNSITHVAKTIRKNGHACYVVSNRCVKGTTLKTDLITRNFFEANGFEHINTFSRKISSKRMPRKNSPTGTTGETTSLMNQEFIVIMKKK